MAEGQSLAIGQGENVVQVARRVAVALDHSVLPIQGPPGAGKTYTGARMICQLVNQGHKVGVTAVTERSWLHLAVTRVMSMSEIVPWAATGSWRLRPASVDMMWSALESALSDSMVQKSSEPIEHLRRSDLIPLGRALAGLTKSVMSRRRPTCQAIEAQLRVLRNLQGAVVSDYGRVPWRILPGPVRATLLSVRGYPTLLELLNEVVEGFPGPLSQPTKQPRRRWSKRW